MSFHGLEGARYPDNQPSHSKQETEGKHTLSPTNGAEFIKESLFNHLAEIKDLRCQRLPEIPDRQVTHKRLLKVIILGDTGESDSLINLSLRHW